MRVHRVIDAFLSRRETAQIAADAQALRSLGEARASVRRGDVVVGVDSLRELVCGRHGNSSAYPTERSRRERIVSDRAFPLAFGSTRILVYDHAAPV